MNKVNNFMLWKFAREDFVKGIKVTFLMHLKRFIDRKAMYEASLYHGVHYPKKQKMLIQFCVMHIWGNLEFHITRKWKLNRR